MVTGGGGAVWVSQGRRLAELDGSGNVRHRWVLPAAPDALSGTCYHVKYGAGNLFAERWPDGTVGRVDTAGGPYAPLIQNPGGSGSFQYLAVGFGSIWIAAQETQIQAGSLRPVVRGTVTQYAAVSGQETTKTVIGQDATAIAVDPASGVWVLDRPDETISRIDPTTGQVTRTIRLHHFPYHIAAANGRVLVSVQSP